MNDTLLVLLLLALLQGQSPSGQSTSGSRETFNGGFVTAGQGEEQRQPLADISFASGKTEFQVAGDNLTGLLRVMQEVRDARARGEVRVIVEGHASGTKPDPTRAAARAEAVKKWLVGTGGLKDVTIEARAGEPRQDKLIAGVSIVTRATTQTAADRSDVLDIAFEPNKTEFKDGEEIKLWRAQDFIRRRLGHDARGQLTIEGHVAANESTSGLAERRMRAVKAWFDQRQLGSNLRIVERAGAQPDKSMVRLTFDMTPRTASR